MGNLWKLGQVGSRLVGGAAGFALGGPAGAAIGASTVGSMIGDSLFPAPEKSVEQFSWNEPSSFQAYESKPDNRLGVTMGIKEEGAGFEGTLKTIDAFGAAAGSYLSTKGGLFGEGGKGTAWLQKHNLVDGPGNTKTGGLFSPPSKGSFIPTLQSSMENLFQKEEQPQQSVPSDIERGNGIGTISEEEFLNPSIYQQPNSKLSAYNTTELIKRGIPKNQWPKGAMPGGILPVNVYGDPDFLNNMNY